VGPRNHVLDGIKIPLLERAFLGVIHLIINNGMTCSVGNKSAILAHG